MAGKHKRRKVYVDRPVQNAMLRQLAMHWSMVFLVILACLVVVEFFAANGLLGVADIVAEVQSRHSPLVIILLLMTPIIAYDAVKLSHRWVGPMVSFRRAMQQLADGEKVESIRFREGDFWHDLAENYNRVLERIERLEKEAAERDRPAEMVEA